MQSYFYGNKTFFQVSCIESKFFIHLYPLISLSLSRRLLKEYLIYSCVGMMSFWIEVSTHISIYILSGTASFRRNMKWVQKFCVAITDSSALKKSLNRKLTCSSN